VFPPLEHPSIMRNLTPTTAVRVIKYQHLPTYLHINPLVPFDKVQYPLRIYKRVLFQVTACVSHIRMRKKATYLHTTLEFKQEGRRAKTCASQGAARMRCAPPPTPPPPPPPASLITSISRFVWGKFRPNITHSVWCCMKLAERTQCATPLNFDSSCRYDVQYKKITFSTLMEINHVKKAQYFHSSHIMNNI